MPFTADQLARRIQRLTIDPWMFLKYACKTVDESDLSSPVKAYPADKRYLHDFVRAWQEQPLNIIEKSRGVMATWTLCCLHLHLAMTGPHRKVFIVAKDFRFAEQIRIQMQGLYDRIPEEVWPSSLRSKIHSREGELIFTDIDSRIITVPSGVDVLRGFTGSAIWFDEFDFHPAARETFKASKSTARNSGRITITSTYSSIPNLDQRPLFWDLVDDNIEQWVNDQTEEGTT